MPLMYKGVEIFGGLGLHPLVSFVWMGVLGKTIGVGTMRDLLENARASKHSAALSWRCSLYRSGRFGLLRGIYGYLATPLALAKYWVGLRMDPFSVTSFMFASRDARPLFRR